MTENQVAEYLTQVTDMMAEAGIKVEMSQDMFILKNAILFERGDRPEGIDQGEMKMCFKNASELALWNPRYIYCEGYAMPGTIPLPMHHGWCIDTETGLVVDPTWEDGFNYFGVPFKTEFVRQELLRREQYGVIDMNWKLLREQAYGPDDYLWRGDE
jgi:hypothetical protein